MLLFNICFWNLICTPPIEQHCKGLLDSLVRLRSRYPIEPYVFTEQYRQQTGGHFLFHWSPSSEESKLKCRGEGNYRWEEKDNPVNPPWGSLTGRPSIYCGPPYIEHYLSWISCMNVRLFFFSSNVKVKTIINRSLLAPLPNCFVWMLFAHWSLKQLCYDNQEGISGPL